MNRSIAILALFLLAACAKTTPPAPKPVVFGAVANPVAPGNNPWLSKSNYYLDPSNTSTNASDSNSCTTSAAPCLTPGEINTRMGGIDPAMTKNTVVINVMSSNVGQGKPLEFNPCVSESIALAIECSLVQVGTTCTLSSVTPRDIVVTGSATQLTATATCITAPGQFLINSTHPSRAYAKTSLGSNRWTITQPATQCDVASNVCPRTEVNTWANGDSITVWNMTEIDADHVGTRCGGGAGYVGFTHCAFNSSGAYIDGPFPVLWEDSEVGGAVTLDGVFGEAENFYHAGGFFTFSSNFINNIQAQWAGLVPAVEAGYFQIGSVFQGAYFGMGVDLAAGTAVAGVFGETNNAGSDVYLEGATDVTRPSTVYKSGAQVWGPGFLREQSGATIAYYLGDATNAFLNGFAATGGLGYSVSFGTVTVGTGCGSQYTTASTIATTCGIPLAPSNFEAAYPGCFENCWIPGGFGIAAIQ